MKTYKGLITSLPENGIAVVGTNPEGRHGLGTALWAKNNAGLRMGHSRGLCGKSYGIVTKDLRKPLHPSITETEIILQIGELYRFAKINPELDFYIFYSSNGYNLNGYTSKEMAKMFNFHEDVSSIPKNIVFEEGFAKLM